MAHVIVPTDLSPSAVEAVDHAVELFDTTALMIDLVHAHFDPTLNDNSMYVPHMLESAGVALATQGAQCRNAHPTVQIRTRTLIGPLPNALDGYTADEGGDMIMMTTSGRQGSTFFGSRTNAVISTCSVPVMVIPKGSHTLRPKRILIAMDPAEPWSVDSTVLHSIIALHRPELLLVHFTKDPEKVLPSAEDGMAHISEAPVRIVEALVPDIEEGLLRTAHEQGADMIVLMHEHKGLIGGWFHHSVTKELALDSPLPLLALIRK